MADNIDKSDVLYSSQLDAFELYHLIVEDSRRPSSRNGGPALPALGHALAGSFATATSKLLIYPLDLVVARLQVQKQLRDPSDDADGEYKSLLDAASKIYRHEGGISAFYTGCAAEVTKGIADSFLFFLAYSFLHQYESRKAAASKKQMSIAKEMGIGIAAGAFSKLITTPLQNIITRQQTAALLTAKNATKDGALRKGDALTVREIAKKIYKERGLQGFWAGYSLSLILTTNPAITFAVDNFLQKIVPISDAGSHITFLIAAVSKAVATAITYPISVAKARAQAMPHTKISVAEGTDKQGNKSSPVAKILRLLSAQYAVFISLQKIYHQEGVTGLYSGLEGEVLKGFLSHGLTMMVKDRVHTGIIELYYFLLKLTSNWPAELRHAQNIASSVVVDARQRVENVAETVVDGGKSLVDNAQQQISSAGESIAEGTRNILSGASTRAENVGVTLAEAGKNVVGDVSGRVENVSTSVLEGGKSVLGDVTGRVSSASTSAYESGKSVLGDATSRVDNVTTTLLEGGKNVLGDTAERANNLGTTVVEGGKNVLGDTAGRADNIGTTLIEGGKNVLEGAKDRTGDASSLLVSRGSKTFEDVKDRIENLGVTVAEAGKSAVEGIKKSS